MLLLHARDKRHGVRRLGGGLVSGRCRARAATSFQLSGYRTEAQPPFLVLGSGQAARCALGCRQRSDAGRASPRRRRGRTPPRVSTRPERLCFGRGKSADGAGEYAVHRPDPPPEREQLVLRRLAPQRQRPLVQRVAQRMRAYGARGALEQVYGLAGLAFVAAFQRLQHRFEALGKLLHRDIEQLR